GVADGRSQAAFGFEALEGGVRRAASDAPVRRRGQRLADGIGVGVVAEPEHDQQDLLFEFADVDVFRLHCRHYTERRARGFRAGAGTGDWGLGTGGLGTGDWGTKDWKDWRT